MALMKRRSLSISGMEEKQWLHSPLAMLIFCQWMNRHGTLATQRQMSVDLLPPAAQNTSNNWLLYVVATAASR